VIASHGRGFYVLDDGATLLRRLTPQTKLHDIADFKQTVPPPTPIPDVGDNPADDARARRRERRGDPARPGQPSPIRHE
jgi:hypothetical protein